MQNRLDDKTPDPGMLWLAIGIGVFSVLASFMLAIYYSGADQSVATIKTAEASEASSTSTDPIALSTAAEAEFD